MAKKYIKTHQKLIAECNYYLIMDLIKLQLWIFVRRQTYLVLHFKYKGHLISEYYESSYFFRMIWKSEFFLIQISEVILFGYRWFIFGIHMMWTMLTRFYTICLTSSWQVIRMFFDFYSKLEDMLTVLLCQAQEAHIIGNASDHYYLCRTIFMLHSGNLFNGVFKLWAVWLQQGLFWGFRDHVLCKAWILWSMEAGRKFNIYI